MRKTHSQPPNYHLASGISLPKPLGLRLADHSASDGFSGLKSKLGLLRHLETPNAASRLSSTSRQNLSIWTKTRSQTPTVLQEMRQTRLEIMRPTLEEQPSSPDIVPQAVSLLKKRPHKRDLIRDVLSRKREMLLVQLKINDKADMIRKYEDQTAEKKANLRKIESRIISDLRSFNEYLDADRELIKEVMKETDNETRERIQLAGKLKDLGEFKTSNINQSLKLFEKLNGLFLFKLFLDKITPHAFLEDAEETETGTEAKTATRTVVAPTVGARGVSFMIHRVSPTFQDDPETPDTDVVQYTLDMLDGFKVEVTPDLKKFLKDPVSTCSLYFRNPKDLIEVQRSIEEENIKLITSTQNLRQKAEEKEGALAAMKTGYEAEREDLIRQKNLWTQRTSEMSNRIATHHLKDDSEHLQVERYIADISAKVARLSDQFGLRQTGDIFADLTQIEQLIDRDTLRVLDIDKRVLKKAEKSINDEKKVRFLMETQRKAEELSAEKISKLQSRAVRLRPQRRTTARSFYRPKQVVPRDTGRQAEGMVSLNSLGD